MIAILYVITFYANTKRNWKQDFEIDSLSYFQFSLKLYNEEFASDKYLFFLIDLMQSLIIKRQLTLNASRSY